MSTKLEIKLKKELDILHQRFLPFQKENEKLRNENEKLMRENEVLREKVVELEKEKDLEIEEVKKEKDVEIEGLKKEKDLEIEVFKKKLHDKKKREVELKRAQDEVHEYKERDEGRKRKMDILVHEKNLMKKQMGEMEILERSSRLEAESLRKLNAQNQEKMINLEEKEEAMKLETKKLKKWSAKMRKTETRSPFRKISPYGSLRRRQSKYSRLQKAMSYLKYLQGAHEDTFFRDLVLALDRKKELKLRLSPQEAFQLYHSTRMTRGTYKFVKKYFGKIGALDPFPGIKPICGIEGDVGSAQLFNVTINKNSKDDDKDIVVVHLNDVSKSLSHRVQELIDNDKLMLDTNSLWVTILGDKGSDETKLCLSIGNVESSNSCHHLIPLGIFEDDDTAVSMEKHIGSILHQLAHLQKINVKIEGKEVDLPIEFFLGGDMKFQYEMIGHAGAVAKLPCMYCKSERKQLVSEYKRGEGIILRTEDSYKEDSSKGKKNPVNGVKAGSKFIFPNVKLPNIIPCSLHIIMGLAQRYGFDYLLKWATQMDGALDVSRKEMKERRISSSKVLLLEKKTTHLQIASRILQNRTPNPTEHLRSVDQWLR